MSEHPELSRAVRDLVLAVERYRARVGRRRGLSATAVTALTHLHMDGPQIPSALARRLEITTASATELLDKLEQGGWVRRHPHPDDRRKLLIELTEVGAEQIGDTFRAFADHVEPLGGDLSPGERAVVLSFVRAADRAFAAHPPDGEEAS